MQEADSPEAEGIVVEALGVLQSLDKQMGAWELERLLGGPYDQGGAVLTIQVLYYVIAS